MWQGDRRTFPRDVEAVANIVRLLEPYRLDLIGVDVKGPAYEELLRGTFEKNDNQQYFTPRHLMEFIVAMVDPTPGSIICDPAAGSGGFLVGALTYVSTKFGTAQLPTLKGVDIDERMCWIARINVFLHGGDPASIVHLTGAGSLKPLEQIQKVLPREAFSAVITNPPFGSDMSDRNALNRLETGKGRTTRRRGVLFVERCLELLSPGGVLAIVLDDSVLNLASNSDIRALLRHDAKVEAVISLPDVAFMPYSTAKSSVLIVRKGPSTSTHKSQVFMADVEHVGNRPNGDPLYRDAPNVDGVRPLLSDLPEVLAAWNSYRRSGRLPRSVDSNKIFTTDLDAYLGQSGDDRIDVNYHHPARAQAQAILSSSVFPTYALEELFDFDTSTIDVAATYGDSLVTWIGLGDIESETGLFQFTEIPGDRIKSSAHVFQPGDVLISKLRPKLRKIILIPEGSPSGVCSAELVVLRKKSRPAAPFLEPYVCFLLRSDLGYGQQVYQITGVGRPRVAIDALKSARVPLPPMKVQRNELRRLTTAFQEYQSLRLRAEGYRTEAQSVLQAVYSSSVLSVTSSSSLARSSTRANSSGTLDEESA